MMEPSGLKQLPLIPCRSPTETYQGFATVFINLVAGQLLLTLLKKYLVDLINVQFSKPFNKFIRGFI